MLAGQLIALALPRGFALAYAICFAMSLLYSVPPVRLKAVAGADWVINMIGFGTLTPYAGWALTRMPLTHAGAWALGGFAPLFAALYPLTQLYQLDEDRARGDRTLALALGVRASLALSIAAMMIAFACFAIAARLSANRASDVRALIALGVAAATWLAVLLPWLARARACCLARTSAACTRRSARGPPRTWPCSSPFAVLVSVVSPNFFPDTLALAL